MPRTTKVVLVHGTNATSDAWAPTTAAIEQRDRGSEAPAIYRTFAWSGANSHDARLKAADELVAFLIAESEEDGDFILVGHSHGGNVCLYAMRDPQVAARVSRVITLGTPFIQVRKRDLSLGWTSILVSGILYLFIAAGIGLVKVLGIVNWRALSSVGTALTALVCILLVAAAARLVYWLAMDSDSLLDTALRKQDEEFARIAHHSMPVRLDAFRVPLDEAGILLRCLHFASEVPAFTFAFVLSARAVFLDWGDRLAERGLFAGFYLAPERFLHALLTSVLYFPLGLVFAAVVVIPKAVRGHAVGFGERGFSQNTLLDIGSTSQPPSGWLATLQDVRPGKSSLRHSTFFTDASVLETVATAHLSGSKCIGSIQTASDDSDFARRAGYVVGSMVFWAVLLLPLWIVLALVLGAV